MDSIQWFTLIVVIIGFGLDIKWVLRNKSNWMIFIPWCLVFLHVIIFYVSRLLPLHLENYFPELQYTIWSSIVRAHTCITIVGYRIYEHRERRV